MSKMAALKPGSGGGPSLNPQSPTPAFSGGPCLPGSAIEFSVLSPIPTRAQSCSNGIAWSVSFGGGQVRRRYFLKMIAGGAAAWPVAAFAQQLNTVRRIGIFLGLSTGPEYPGAGEILRPLKAAMRDAGWIEDTNVRFEIRFGGGNMARISAAGDELVALAPDLIYATGLPPVQAQKDQHDSYRFFAGRRSGRLRTDR
jgi:hypothetical protein